MCRSCVKTSDRNMGRGLQDADRQCCQVRKLEGMQSFTGTSPARAPPPAGDAFLRKRKGLTGLAACLGRLTFACACIWCRISDFAWLQAYVAKLGNLQTSDRPSGSRAASCETPAKRSIAPIRDAVLPPHSTDQGITATPLHPAAAEPDLLNIAIIDHYDIGRNGKNRR